MAMYGLEYALFFGVPENKTELLEGGSRWAIPFMSREEGEFHFKEWLETLSRWKQVEPTPVQKSDTSWLTMAGGVRLELFRRPIEIRIPIAFETFGAFLDTFYRRDYWPGQPVGLESGFDSPYDRGDICMNLWRLIEMVDHRQGKHSGRVDIALDEWACVAPDFFYYRPGRKNIMIERECFRAAPDLVADVLVASSRSLNRTPREAVYRRAGIPH
jgi:hypothetical protein